MKDWTKNKDKFDAIVAVLRHILNRDDKGYKDMCDQCLQDNDFAKQLFKDPGDIDVPPDAKVVFVPVGDTQRPDYGSLILDAPPSTAGGQTDDQLLANFVLSHALGPVSPAPNRHWQYVDERAAATVDVLRHLIDNQTDVTDCLKYDGHTFNLFSNGPGRIQPPTDIKIIVMPPGQRALKAGGSLVLEIPTRKMNDKQLVQASTPCCYHYWFP